MLASLSCDKINPKENELMIRGIKVILGDYFQWKYDSFGNEWYAHIPAEYELPDGKRENGYVQLYCVDRKYYVYCLEPACIPYTNRKQKIVIIEGLIDGGSFDMKSYWYDLCKRISSAYGETR